MILWDIQEKLHYSAVFLHYCSLIFNSKCFHMTDKSVAKCNSSARKLTYSTFIWTSQAHRTFRSFVYSVNKYVTI